MEEKKEDKPIKIPVDLYIDHTRSRPAARKDVDKTQHGGHMTTGSYTVFIDKRAATRVGDLHSCPETTEHHIPHEGGPILQGSSRVFINGHPAARQFDYTQCLLTPPDERDVEFMACRPEQKIGGGGEWSKHEGAEFKAAIEPAHFECSAIHIPAKVGPVEVPTDIGKVTGVAKAGVEYADGKVFAGGTLDFGASLVEIEPQIETPSIPIWGTDYEVAAGAKLSLSAGSVKLKATAAVETDPKKGLVIKGGAGIGAVLAGVGLEGFLALKKKHEDEPVLVFDRIEEGSSKTFIGG